jgi:hypothetical protein
VKLRIFNPFLHSPYWRGTYFPRQSHPFDRFLLEFSACLFKTGQRSKQAENIWPQKSARLAFSAGKCLRIRRAGRRMRL